MIKCIWCGQPLRLDLERGWVHADDGQVYKEDGHCALPDKPRMPVGAANYMVAKLSGSNRLLKGVFRT